MAVTHSIDFLSQLRNENDELRNFSESILELPNDLLVKRPNEKQWNLVECFDHMNRATELYLDQVEEKLGQLKPSHNGKFKPSWLASMFSKGLAPGKSGQIKYKMKTLKPFVPQSLSNTESLGPIKRFMHNLDRYERILHELAGMDLRSFKVVTALGPILKFNVGDALRFVHAHNRRHVQQSKNILALFNEVVRR